jgi:hypothetical protein
MDRQPIRTSELTAQILDPGVLPGGEWTDDDQVLARLQVERHFDGLG